MAFTPGFNSRFYVGPQRWSVYARGFGAGFSIDQIDVSTVEDRAKKYANGRLSGNCTLDMMLDDATSGQFALANTWASTPQPITLGFDGLDLADTAWMILGNESNATIADTLDDVATINVTVQPDGPLDWGYVIEAATAITADTTGTTYDCGLGSGTTNGGVAHLHVTAFSGLTSDVIILEHSANNTDWTTLGTFATVTGTTSERLVIAAGTTVSRYLRVSDDVTGTGSVTRLVTFARR